MIDFLLHLLGGCFGLKAFGMIWHVVLEWGSFYNVIYKSYLRGVTPNFGGVFSW